MGAQLHMVPLVSLQFLGVHHIPALAVLVVDERVLVTFGLDGSLQRHQGSFRTHLIRLGFRRVAILRGAWILLRESSQAHRESQSQQTNRYFFHRFPLVGESLARFLLLLYSTCLH